MNFRDDDSRTRAPVLGNNLSSLRPFVLTLLKRDRAKSRRWPSVPFIVTRAVLENQFKLFPMLVGAVGRLHTEAHARQGACPSPESLCVLALGLVPEPG